MRTLKLSWANLRSKPLNTLLSVMLLAFGVGIISLLILLEHQLQEKFKRNIKDIDMVIGAPGSPIQIILSSVYQVDAPTGNIPLSTKDKLKRSPFVKKAIPISIGDNYRSYRIVGTQPAYLEHYELEVGEGKMWSESMEVVVGYSAAEITGLQVGDTFASSHGLDEAGEAHDEKPFVVSGILEPSYTVADQLILTSLESVWDVHGGHDEDEEKPKEVTSLLINLSNKAGLVMLPGMFRDDKVQVVPTAVVVNRLTEGFGIGADTLKYIAYAIIFLSCASLFISLYNSLKERKYELAIMRSMGGSRAKLFFLMLYEGIIITIMGIVAGLLLSRIGVKILSTELENQFHYGIDSLGLLPLEWGFVILMIGIGTLASFLPAIQAIRIDISKTLADE